MIRRSVIILWIGLPLAGCEKPDPQGQREDAVAPPERLSHRPRGQVSDAPRSLRAMMEAADKIESPAAREKAFAEVAWNSIEIDSELAHEAFQKLPADSTEKIRLIQHYAMRLAEQDPDEALAWASTVGSGQEIAAANGQIALVLAETDPRRAANLLSASDAVCGEFDVALVQVLQRWAARSPSEAAAWAVLFPPGAVRQAGIKIIAGQWLARDASAAFDWFGKLQDEELRKETARALEGVILQQPRDIRDAWLQHADARIQGELRQQREQAIKDVGDNLPPLTK